MTGWGAREVTVRYGRARALDRFSLEVHRGTISALVGGDGAGKSTALKALVGLVPPSEGRVLRPSAREIGYLSAGPGIYRDLTVVENLLFVGRAYDLDRAESARRIDALLERTGLDGARARLASHLSGGMRQKLALAGAIIHSPRLLVLDEPTTGVDPVSSAELWRLIARAAGDGAAVVIATSYMDEAERAEQVVVLSDGVTLGRGTPTELRRSIPGRLYVGPAAGSRLSWRRGAVRHIWSPDGSPVPDARPIDADLEDALIVAELVHEEVG